MTDTAQIPFELAEGGRPSDDAKVRVRFLVVALAVFSALFACYWLLIRTTYSPLLTEVAPQRAAEIVKVLDASKIAYRLAENGRTIEVPSDKVDGARLELVGSELPMRGQVGFELFNQSEMGLTEFAQRINFQRALQGELARTILMLDGIAGVRVHLGLPEQRLFREEQVRPKASVTLQLKPSATLTEKTVVGIQQMVAAAVPELDVGDVAILDGSGRLISTLSAASDLETTGNDAFLNSARRLIVDAIAREEPDLRYGLTLKLKPIVPTSGKAVRNGESIVDRMVPQKVLSPRGNPDFAVQVRLTTQEPLEVGLRDELLVAIQSAIGFEATRGDAIVFLVGEVVRSPASQLPRPASDRVVASTGRTAPPEGSNESSIKIVLIALGFLALLALVFLVDRRNRAIRRTSDLLSFADQLRQRLHAQRVA